MRANRLFWHVIAALLVVASLQGCQRQSRPDSPVRPSVSFPIASGKVWRDTTAQITISGIGRFIITVQNGQISVEPPLGLKRFRWAVNSIRRDTATPQTAAKMPSPPAVEGDMDGDGVPDCEDWCMDVPGTPENRGCPPGVEGTPPIRWVEMLRMTEGGDEIILEYGLDECEEQ